MFDIGMTELLLIGIVALIVVGPKDLPGMFRTLGRFTAKARSLGREFTRAMNDAADESGIKSAADGLKAAANPKKFGLDKINDAVSSFEKWDPTKPSGKVGKDDPKPLDDERAEDARKIREAATKNGQAKLDREKAAAEAAATKTSAKPAVKKATVKKTAARTTAKPAAKSALNKSAINPAAKTTATKATAKPAAKSAPKPAAKTTPKPAAKAPAKKPATKKAPAKKAASE